MPFVVEVSVSSQLADIHLFRFVLCLTLETILETSMLLLSVACSDYLQVLESWLGQNQLHPQPALQYRQLKKMLKKMLEQPDNVRATGELLCFRNY